MTAQPVPEHSEWQNRMIDAMRAELDWAPMRFESWSAYERARPLLPGEQFEIVGHFPDHGYVLQYRSLLGELTQSLRYPIDQQPDVTVRGSVGAFHLAHLRRLDRQSDPQPMIDYIAQIMQPTYTLPATAQVARPSVIPSEPETASRYEVEPAQPGISVPSLADQTALAFRVAGGWRLRLSAPVDVTSRGEVVFEPIGFNNGDTVASARLIFRRPAPSQPAEVALLRPEGLGRWKHTATLIHPDELRGVARDAAQRGLRDHVNHQSATPKGL